MRPHYLPRQAKAYTGAAVLGREEGDEYLSGALLAYGLAVVGHAYDDPVRGIRAGGYLHRLRPGLEGVLYEIDEYAAYLRLVGVYQEIVFRSGIGAGRAAGLELLGGKLYHLMHQLPYQKPPPQGTGNSGEFAVRLHELHQILGGGRYGLEPCLDLSRARALPNLRSVQACR